MSGKLTYLERILHSLSRWLNWVAAGALAAMMLLVGVNVLLRLFGRPIWGSFEIVGFLGAVLISFALLYTTITQSHVAVDIVMSRLPQRAQAVIGRITTFLSFGVFVVIAWQSARFGMNLWQSGQVSSTLRLPLHPLLFGIAFAFAIASVVLLVDFINSMTQAVKK
jgi:TRAP-type C4-dicarboxylate transport system permease small subunit